jgi:hypothetical protein
MVDCRTYRILFAIDFPDAPFPFILDDFLDVSHSTFSPALLGPRSRYLAVMGYQDFSSALRVRVDFTAWHMTLSFAYSDMAPPRYKLFGILEAAGTNVEALKHRKMLTLFPGCRLTTSLVFAACILASTLTRMARDVTQNLFAIVAGVPRAKADVS